MEYCRRYQKTVTVISDCSTGELVSPEGTQDEKTQDTGPRELRRISKGGFQRAQTLTSSHWQKSTKFLKTPSFLLLIISSTCLLLQNSYISQLPLHLLEAVFSVLLEMLLWSSNLLACPLKKTQLLTFRLRSWHPVPPLHGKQMGKQWKQSQILFFWAPKSLQMVIAAMKLKDAYSLEGKL